jgi:zinc protease
LKKNLDDSLAYYNSVIVEPGFAEEDFARLQAKQIADIRRETREPLSVAMRLMPSLLYGPQSPYGRPLSGNGFEQEVTALKRADCVTCYQQLFSPSTSTLLVTGDFTREELVPKLERTLGRWKNETPVGRLAPVEKPTNRTLYQPSVTIIDKPGAVQSVIVAANLAPARDTETHLASELMNQILGGSFTSRINMNLRETKHWTYGARSELLPARAVRPFFVYTQVQTDKTADTMKEIAKEIQAIYHEQPISDSEFKQIRQAQALRLSGRWETLDQVMGSLTELVLYQLPADYFQTVAQRVNRVTCAEARQAALQILRPKNLTWIVVGDRAKIESEVQKAGLGEIRLQEACQ